MVASVPAYGFALLDQFQCAPHASERQIEARRRATCAPGIQTPTTRPRMSTTGEPEDPPDGAGRGLQIESVEVVIFADAILGRVAVETRQRARRGSTAVRPALLPTTRISRPICAPFRIQRQQALG